MYTISSNALLFWNELDDDQREEALGVDPWEVEVWFAFCLEPVFQFGYSDPGGLPRGRGRLSCVRNWNSESSTNAFFSSIARSAEILSHLLVPGSLMSMHSD